MTNCVRQKEDHIHAGLALHAGLLLEQYRRLTSDVLSHEKHDATLTLAVLQMLLTNLEELFHRLDDDRSKLLSTVIGDTPVWALEQKFIQEHPRGVHTREMFYDIARIRHGC